MWRFACGDVLKKHSLTMNKIIEIYTHFMYFFCEHNLTLVWGGSNAWLTVWSVCDRHRSRPSLSHTSIGDLLPRLKCLPIIVILTLMKTGIKIWRHSKELANSFVWNLFIFIFFFSFNFWKRNEIARVPFASHGSPLLGNPS